MNEKTRSLTVRESVSFEFVEEREYAATTGRVCEPKPDMATSSSMSMHAHFRVIPFCLTSFLSVVFFAEFPLDIALHVTVPDIVPFVKGFFSFTDTKLNLDDAVFEVNIERYQRKTLFLNLADESLDLVPMKEQLLGSVGVMIENRRVCILGNMTALEPDFSIHDIRKCIRIGNIARTDGFYLSPLEHDTALDRFFNGIVEMRLAILRDYLDGCTGAHLGLIIGAIPRLVNESPSWYHFPNRYRY